MAHESVPDYKAASKQAAIAKRFGAAGQQKPLRIQHSFVHVRLLVVRSLLCADASFVATIPCATIVP